MNINIGYMKDYYEAEVNSISIDVTASIVEIKITRIYDVITDRWTSSIDYIVFYGVKNYKQDYIEHPIRIPFSIEGLVINKIEDGYNVEIESDNGSGFIRFSCEHIEEIFK